MTLGTNGAPAEIPQNRSIKVATSLVTVEQLQSLWRSPANRFPNPRFQIDHLATGCVALIQSDDSVGDQRIN